MEILGGWLTEPGRRRKWCLQGSMNSFTVKHKVTRTSVLTTFCVWTLFSSFLSLFICFRRYSSQINGRSLSVACRNKFFFYRKRSNGTEITRIFVLEVIRRRFNDSFWWSTWTSSAQGSRCTQWFLSISLYAYATRSVAAKALCFRPVHLSVRVCICTCLSVGVIVQLSCCRFLVLAYIMQSLSYYITSTVYGYVGDGNVYINTPSRSHRFVTHGLQSHLSEVNFVHFLHLDLMNR